MGRQVTRTGLDGAGRLQPLPSCPGPHESPNPAPTALGGMPAWEVASLLTSCYPRSFAHSAERQTRTGERYRHYGFG